MGGRISNLLLLACITMPDKGRLWQKSIAIVVLIRRISNSSANLVHFINKSRTLSHSSARQDKTSPGPKMTGKTFVSNCDISGIKWPRRLKWGLLPAHNFEQVTHFRSSGKKRKSFGTYLPPAYAYMVWYMPILDRLIYSNWVHFVVLVVWYDLMAYQWRDRSDSNWHLDIIL